MIYFELIIELFIEILKYDVYSFISCRRLLADTSYKQTMI